jgi:hypothetical protein
LAENLGKIVLPGDIIYAASTANPRLKEASTMTYARTVAKFLMILDACLLLAITIGKAQPTNARLEAIVFNMYRKEWPPAAAVEFVTRRKHSDNPYEILNVPACPVEIYIRRKYIEPLIDITYHENSDMFTELYRAAKFFGLRTDMWCRCAEIV